MENFWEKVKETDFSKPAKRFVIIALIVVQKIISARTAEQY